MSLYATEDEMFFHAMLETETTPGISNRGVNTSSWLHGAEKSKRPKRGMETSQSRKELLSLGLGRHRRR